MNKKLFSNVEVEFPCWKIYSIKVYILKIFKMFNQKLRAFTKKTFIAFIVILILSITACSSIPKKVARETVETAYEMQKPVITDSTEEGEI